MLEPKRVQVKGGDAVLQTMRAEPNELKLQLLGLNYFVNALTSTACTETDLTKRQARATWV